MQPRPVTPAATADQNGEHQQQEPDRSVIPPPPKEIYATLASTLANPIDAEQYYHCVLQELPANHATLQGWRQAKGGNIEWGAEGDLLWEDTWEGTMDTFLEAAAANYPRPPGDTRQGLHALLAFHSWKHHDTITLHTLNHNPRRGTPEDDTTTAITIQQDPENPAGYHLTWSDPAPHPPASPILQDVFATISAELQEAKAPQQPEDKMPQAPLPPTAQERPHQEPLTHPITKMELPTQHGTSPDRIGFRELPQEWAIHNGTLRWDEITPGLQAICLHSTTEPTNTWALPADCHHLLVTIQGDAAITPKEEDPVTAAPAHIPQQTSLVLMTVHPDPTPWQAMVITHPAPKRPHAHLASKVGGHQWVPPPGTPRTHTHQPHPPPGARSSPSTTWYTQPGIMGVRHTHEPTSSRGH